LNIFTKLKRIEITTKCIKRRPPSVRRNLKKRIWNCVQIQE
jgi:hypothetical protein